MSTILYKNTFYIDADFLNLNWIVYLLKFPNGKVYVGQTITKLRNRLTGHIVDSVRDHRNRKICNALRKGYKPECLILEHGKSIEELNHMETIYIIKYSSVKNGYNASFGGKNRRLTNETRRKIGLANTGKNKITEATRMKMSRSQKGKSLSTNHKRKIGLGNSKPLINLQTGMIHLSTISAGEFYNTGDKNIAGSCKTGVSCMGFNFAYLNESPPIIKPRQKRRIKNVDTGEEFNSIIEAAKKHNLNRVTLGAYLIRNNGKCGGFQWKYLDDPEIISFKKHDLIKNPG